MMGDDEAYADKRCATSAWVRDDGFLDGLRLLGYKLKVIAIIVNRHPLIVADTPVQEFVCQRVFDMCLDSTLERSGTVGRIKSGTSEPFACRAGQVDCDVSGGEPALQVMQLYVDDLLDFSQS